MHLLQKICVTDKMIQAQSNTICESSVPRFDYVRSFDVDYAKICALVYQDISEVKKITIREYTGNYL